MSRPKSAPVFSTPMAKIAADLRKVSRRLTRSAAVARAAGYVLDAERIASQAAYFAAEADSYTERAVRPVSL